MKHEDIYYTCDRCGKKIKNIAPSPIDCINSYHTMALTEEQIAKRFDESPGKIICTVGFATKHYDLCPECRKELKKFLTMKV